MQNILFFDTETTSLIPKENFQFEKIDFYPRLVQLSALLYTESGELLKTFDFVIKPSGFIIENSGIHGITNEIAYQNGYDLTFVIKEFSKLCSEASLLVCHNFAFDSSIIKSELIKVNNPDFLTKIPSFCTMTECNPLTKSISLKNLHFELFESHFTNHHNSIVDAQITAKCFFELIKQGSLVKRGNYYSFNNSKNNDNNFELDKDNLEFFRAFELINDTTKNIFLTGKAGTGKTTFLKYLRNKSNKQIITLAFTGVAAINAGGQTINSFFQLPFRPFLPDDKELRKENINDFLKYTSNKRETIKSLEILVLDEVSMVRADIIDAIDHILRYFRKKEHLAFGGVQVIFIGDLFQLPPIEGDDWNTIKAFYNSPYFFDSKTIKNLINEGNFVCRELNKVYRQKEIEFIEILNRIRVGKHTNNDLIKINDKNNKAENINALLSNNYIVLSTTNQKVNTINETKLIEIESKSFIFEGTTNQDFPESMKIAPQRLELKLNAQVMLLKNIGSNYNGQIGKITALKEDSVEVQFEGNNNVKKIEKAIWSKIEYSYNKEKHKIEEIVKGTYTQFPLKLAWAITVHKSQGLTFTKVIADVSSSFASGQVYVALSRCTSLSGLKITSPLPLNAIKIDNRVVQFSEIQTPETTVISFINEGKADKFYHLFKHLLLKNKVEDAFLKLEEAIKFRNDLFTSKFQSFVQKYLNKYNNYQNLISILNNEVKTLNSDKYQLIDDISNLNIEISDITSEYKKNLKKSKQNNEALTEETKTLKYEIEKLKEELKIANQSKSKSEIENKELKKKNNLMVNEILDLKQISKTFSNNNELMAEKLKVYKNGISRRDTEILGLKENLKTISNKLDKINSKWFVKVFD